MLPIVRSYPLSSHFFYPSQQQHNHGMLVCVTVFLFAMVPANSTSSQPDLVTRSSPPVASLLLPGCSDHKKTGKWLCVYRHTHTHSVLSTHSRFLFSSNHHHPSEHSLSLSVSLTTRSQKRMLSNTHTGTHTYTRITA